MKSPFLIALLGLLFCGISHAQTQENFQIESDLAKYKTEFGYSDDATALEKSIQPTDQLLPAIQADVLLISCHGTADRTVPYEHNAAKLV
jgi:hypothetical protein